jgi:circadian clock protein KaiB
MEIKPKLKSVVDDQAVEDKIILRLYITGMSENSVRAIHNITQLCHGYLKERFDLEVVDIYKNPSVAEEQKIIFSPSLVRQHPLPKKTFIGDLSDAKKVILGLGITFNE